MQARVDTLQVQYLSSADIYIRLTSLAGRALVFLLVVLVLLVMLSYCRLVLCSLLQPRLYQLHLPLPFFSAGNMVQLISKAVRWFSSFGRCVHRLACRTPFMRQQPLVKTQYIA